MSMTKVVVPDVWGESKDIEGAITNWFFDEGAVVKKGDVLAEGMVEKVNFEITAPASGKLARVLAPVDTAIHAGSVVAEIEASA